MDRKEAANGLQLIKIACLKLKGNFSALYMGAMAMTTPLILVAFMTILMSMLFEVGWIVPIGIAIFMILAGPLQVGYIKYFNAVLDRKQPRISLVYSQLRFSGFTIRTIYISTLLFMMYVIGGILFMIPACFAISFFSMTLFFLEKFEYTRLSVAMKESAKKMVSNRLAMFAYKLIFYFIYFMLFIVGGLCLLLVNTLAMENLAISWVVAMCATVIFIFMYTLITVYFHSCNQIFFEDVLSRDEKKRASKVKSMVNTTEQLTEVKDVEKKEEPKEVQETKKVEKTKEVQGTKKVEKTNKKKTVKETEPAKNEKKVKPQNEPKAKKAKSE